MNSKYVALLSALMTFGSYSDSFVNVESLCQALENIDKTETFESLNEYCLNVKDPLILKNMATTIRAHRRALGDKVRWHLGGPDISGRGQAALFGVACACDLYRYYRSFRIIPMLNAPQPSIKSALGTINFFKAVWFVIGCDVLYGYLFDRSYISYRRLCFLEGVIKGRLQEIEAKTAAVA